MEAQTYKHIENHLYLWGYQGIDIVLIGAGHIFLFLVSSSFVLSLVSLLLWLWIGKKLKKRREDFFFSLGSFLSLPRYLKVRREKEFLIEEEKEK